MPKSFDVEHEMLKLLFWIRDHGFGPIRATARDQFLCPITKRIYSYGELHDHQKQTVLWIPNIRELKRFGAKVLNDSATGLVHVVMAGFRGIGFNEEGALLSLLQQVRSVR